MEVIYKARKRHLSYPFISEAEVSFFEDHKKHKYPPEGMDDAVQTVMSQCEMWTDNVMTA